MIRNNLLVLTAPLSLSSVKGWYEELTMVLVVLRWTLRVIFEYCYADINMIVFMPVIKILWSPLEKANLTIKDFHLLQRSVADSFLLFLFISCLRRSFPIAVCYSPREIRSGVYVRKTTWHMYFIDDNLLLVVYYQLRTGTATQLFHSLFLHLAVPNPQLFVSRSLFYLVLSN